MKKRVVEKKLVREEINTEVCVSVEKLGFDIKVIEEDSSTKPSSSGVFEVGKKISIFGSEQMEGELENTWVGKFGKKVVDESPINYVDFELKEAIIKKIRVYGFYEGSEESNYKKIKEIKKGFVLFSSTMPSDELDFFNTSVDLDIEYKGEILNVPLSSFVFDGYFEEHKVFLSANVKPEFHTLDYFLNDFSISFKIIE